MGWFAARGFDPWCLDNEGYGISSGAGSTIGADNALIDQLLGGVPVTDSA